MDMTEVERAKVLRAEGKTYPKIAAEIGRSKSWVSLVLNPRRLEAHRQRARDYSARRWATSPEKVLAEQRKYVRANRDKVNAAHRKYWRENIEARRRYSREYYRAYMDANPSAQRAAGLRLRFLRWICLGWRKDVKMTVKRLEMNRIVGCTPAEAYARIEAQFTPEMNWANWATVWEFDHIRPLSHFNLMDDAQVLEAMNISNVRPLLVSENRGRERREGLMGAVYKREQAAVNPEKSAQKPL
jgi:hypothetical protein